MPEDRHGRASRSDNDQRRRPSDGFRLRDATRFARLTEDALATLPEPLLEALEDAELEIVDVPPEPPPGAEEVALAEFHPADGRGRARVTVYRRPLEARALARLELVELVRVAVGREVAVALGLDIDLDDDWDED